MQSKSITPSSSQSGNGTDIPSSLPGNEFRPLGSGDERSATSTDSMPQFKPDEPNSDRVAALRQSVEQMTDLVSSQSVKAGKFVNQYVHQKPWASLGIAAVFGFLAGAFITRAIHGGGSE